MKQLKYFILALAALSFSNATSAIADDDAAIQSTLDALYDVISGPVGEPRDFDRMRDLFVEGAAMGSVSAGETGRGAGRIITLDEYIERSGPWLVENGITERETRNEIDVWGEIAVVRSAYEGLNGQTGEVFVTGVNFITLYKLEGEWKIASILWRTETDDWPVQTAFD